MKPVLQQTVVLTAANFGNSVTCGIAVFKHSPGFKELRKRVNKFAGDGREDFEVRLADYCEATGDCGWTNQLRANWISCCFQLGLQSILGISWQQTLNAENKATWVNVVQSYKGHYVVHIVPHTHRRS